MRKFNQLYPGMSTLMNQEQRDEFCSHLRKLKFPTVKFNMNKFLSRDGSEYVSLDLQALSFRSINERDVTKSDMLETIPFNDFIDMLCGAYAGDLSMYEKRMERFLKSNLLPGTGMMTESPEELKEMLEFMSDHGYALGTTGDNWEDYPAICIDEDMDVVGAKFEQNLVSRKEFESIVMGKTPVNVPALVGMYARSKNTKMSNPLAAIFGRM
jgi:hypothetical protein